MGLTDWIKKLFGAAPSEVSSSAPASAEIAQPHNVLTPPVDQWVMPRHEGRDICDWGDDIARLKREGRLEEALSLARGCIVVPHRVV